jgi:hypothetical protein
MWHLLGERGTGSGFFQVLQFYRFSIISKKPHARSAFIFHPRFVLERGEIRLLTYKFVYCARPCCLILTVNKKYSTGDHLKYVLSSFIQSPQQQRWHPFCGAGSDISATYMRILNMTVDIAKIRKYFPTLSKWIPGPRIFSYTFWFVDGV